MLRHLTESALHSGRSGTIPAFDFRDQAELKETAPACSLLESFVFLFKHIAFFRDLVEDTHYCERLRLAAQRTEDLELLLPMVAVFNLMADTFHGTGQRNPSAEEFFPLMSDRSDAGASQLAQLTRKISQSFRFFCCLTREAPAIPEIIRKFQDWAASLQSGRAFLPQDFLAALARDASVDPADIRKALEDQNWALLQGWLERVEHLDRRGSHLTRYFFLEEIGRGSHHASDALESIRDWYTAPLAELIRQDFGRQAAGLCEIEVPLYKDKCAFQRFDLRGNGNFGFMDLSRLDYTTQKNSVMIDMIYPNRKTSRLAIEKYKVDLLNSFVLKTDGLYQDLQYFKRPRFRDLIKKINETKETHDFLNDYDIAVFFEKEAKRCRKTYLSYYSVDERVSELVENSSTGIPRVKAYCLDNKRLSTADAVKVVYSFKRYSFNEDSTSFMLYLPEDNEETVGDFLNFLLKTHFGAVLAAEDRHGSLKKDLLASLEFTFMSNLSFEAEPALLTTKNGLAPGMTFLDLIAELGRVCPELSNEVLQDGPARDCIVNCYFTRSLIEKYGEGRFATDPVENNLKTKIEAAAHLTDVVDYLIHNHQFTTKERPAQVVSGRECHEVLRALPTGALLPSVIVVCVSRINNILEFSAPFEFECLPLHECRQLLAINRCYQMTGMICRKKQANAASPLLFYPVHKLPDSPNDEMVGYMPKEGRAPLSKFKKEQIDFVVLSRLPFSFFA